MTPHSLARALPFALVVLSACAGGGEVEDTGPPETFGLTFSGSGYDAHDGLTIRTLVLEDGTLDERGTGEAVITGGVFSFDYGGEALTEGEGYSILWYIDSNANATCEGDGVDVTGFFWFGDVANAWDVAVTPGAPNEPTDVSCDFL